jgi:hypothetical protein
MNQHRLHNQWKLQGCKDQQETNFSLNNMNWQGQVQSTPMP